MTRSTKILAAAAASLLALSLAWAQPGGGFRGGGMMMSAEQLLGTLAFHPEIALTDDQLVALRAALRDSHAEQLAMRESMRGGEVDREAMREMMSEMRQTMMAAAGGVLTEAQREILRTTMERPGRGGGPGGGGGFRQ